MSETPNNPRQRTDQDYYNSRVEIANQGGNALLLINGGAAVSILAFLQAVWSDAPALAKVALVGLAFYAAGVLFGAASYQLRIRVSLAHQHRRASFPALNRLSYSVQIAGLVAFLLGTAAIVVGAWPLLPETQKAQPDARPNAAEPPPRSGTPPQA